jgi:formate hydrogenlyase subunit 6/NADH:ubiquinone oxidoreductase subunit I
MVSPVPPAVRQKPRHGRAPFLRGYFGNIRRALTSTLEGMSVTMSWMFRRPMTVQYPDKIDKPVQEMLPETYRGVLEVDLDRCTGCLLCAKGCPIGCIDISVCKNPVTGTRDLEKFDIDIGLCMYCGICAEICNFDALVHTTEFEATVSRPEDLTLHFVKEPQPISKQKAGEGTPRKPHGSILPGIIPSLGRRRPYLVPVPPGTPVTAKDVTAEPKPAPPSAESPTTDAVDAAGSTNAPDAPTAPADPPTTAPEQQSERKP